MNRILIVDDEEGVLNALRRVLTRGPCRYGRFSYDLEAETFASPQAALERARSASFDLVLSDFHMPKMDGVEFLSRIEQLQPDAVRMILSGSCDINAIRHTIHRANIYGMVPKPWNDEFLLSMIGQALNHRDLLLEKRELARRAPIESGE